MVVISTLNPSLRAQTKTRPPAAQASERGQILTVDFCKLLRNIYRYEDKPVRTTARWERSRQSFVLRDSRCEAEFPIEAVIVNVQDQDEAGRLHVSTIQSPDFGGRAMVTLVGTLNDPAHGEGFFRFYFKVIRFEQVDHFIEPYKGALHIGSTYRAVVRGDEDTGLRLVQPMRMEFHTAVRVEWMNVPDFPMLANLGKKDRQTIVFRVVSGERKQMGERRWDRTLECKILRID